MSSTMWRAVALATVGASTALTSGQTPPPTHGYYYFDEFRPLALDSARLAILDRDEPGPVAVAAAAPGALAADQVTAWPIAGWYLCDLNGPAATAAAVEASVATAAAGPEIDFASPVFVGDDGGPLIVTPDILVGFHPQVEAADAEAILAASGAGRVTDVNWGGMPRVYRLRSAARNGFEVLAAANALAQRPEVRFAEPDMIFTGYGALVPNDPGFPDLWGIHNTGQLGGTPDMDMDGPEAWDISTGDPSIIVAIIDVGIQQDHPDINQIPGTDSTSEGPGDGGPVNSCDDHGTAVAGCVSATINNNLGTVGIAPDCVSASARTFITVICGCCWTSEASWTVDSLAWAEANGVRVTNNSNSYGFQSSAIDLKYLSTRGQGMVHFGSAGNGSASSINYPASLDSINAIAALDRDGNLASFSNFGVGLAFSAPGIDVLTTDRTGSDGFVAGDYLFFGGTSVASPYAAGVAALALSVNPALDAEGVEQVLQRGAVDLGGTGYDTVFGWGFVNANNALDSALDCNGNGIPDFDDINSGPPGQRSSDCNGNSIPDECEADCDNDGTPDPCEILADPSLDCDLNGLIDVCEIAGNPNLLDCNANGALDSCDILADPSLDCDLNGLIDVCEIAGNPNLLDCNANGVLDSCDIAAGSSLDVNGNGVPDACECLADCEAVPSGGVDVPDLLALLGAWGGPQTPGTTCDFDESGAIAVPDLLQLLANWGPCPLFFPPCGAAGNGSCCFAKLTPGCDQVACCESVCGADPYCCDTRWDNFCAGDAAVDPNCDCP